MMQLWMDQQDMVFKIKAILIERGWRNRLDPNDNRVEYWQPPEGYRVTWRVPLKEACRWEDMEAAKRTVKVTANE